MTKYILTIAIPTYNRKKYLAECLNSVIAQAVEHIEILVCDNASTDGTKELLSKYKTEYGIHCFHNRKNLGMDGNFYMCLKKSRGRYVHLLSDDDIMLPGTIQAALDIIRRHSPDLIHLNSCGFGKNSTILSPPRLKLQKNIVTHNKDRFIRIAGIHITFLSSLIIKRENLRETGDLRRFIGTYFLHAHAALLCTKGADKTMAVVAHNSIAARGGNTGGYNLYSVWVEKYKNLLFQTGVYAGYNPEILKNLYINNLKNEIRNFIIGYREKEGGLSIDKPWLLIRHTYKYPKIWFLVYPAAFVPKLILPLLKQ